jgi:hypothetical protein
MIAEGQAFRREMPAPFHPSKFGEVPGRGHVSAWAKDMVRVYETRIVVGVQGGGVYRGSGTVSVDRYQEQFTSIAKEAIAHFKTLPTYKGQFDHIDTDSGGHLEQAAPAQARPADLRHHDGDAASVVSSTHPQNDHSSHGVNVADLRNTLMA